MDRRAFLKSVAGAGALSAAGTLATPAISQRAAARALRFVPQADLANFDPIWGTQYVVRNASAMVWDTLYGVDEHLQPQRQMAEAEEVSADGLTWTFRLRPGLKFHDGEKGAREGGGGKPRAVDGTRPHGPDDQADPAGAHGRRRPHREMGAEEALSEDAAGARQAQHPDRLHHAGTDRQVRPVQADQRIYRQRADALRQGRVGAGRQGGIREIRRLSAAAGTRGLARGGR